MSKKACIYGKNNLTKEDNIELIEVYETHLDVISDVDLDLANTTVEKQALYKALETLTKEALAERESLADIAQDHGVVLKPRTLVSIIGKPITLVKTALVESEKLVVTNQNVPTILERLENIPNEKLNTPEIVKLRSVLLNATNRLITKPALNTEKNLAALQQRITKLEGLVELTKPSKAGFQQIGTKGQEQTTGNLSEDVLIDGLVANANKKDRTPISERTSITTYLTPKNGTNTINVLRTVHNLFSRVSNTETKNETIAELPTLTDAQLGVLPILADFTSAFKTKLEGTGKNGLLKFFTNATVEEYMLEGRFKEGANNNNPGNPFGYLIQVDSQGNKFLNENLVAAMAMTGYNWVATQGKSTLSNDDAAINTILGRQAEDHVPVETRTALRRIGTVKQTIEDSLGSAAYGLLDLKGKPGIDGNFEPRLQQAMGSLILGVLLDSDILVQEEMSNKVMKTLAPEVVQENPNASTNFIKVNFDLDVENNLNYVPNSEVQSMIDTLKNSDNVLKSLFNIKSHKSGPTFEPVKTTVKTLKGNFMKVPASTQKILGKMQSVKWEIKANVLEVFEALGTANILKLEGYINDVESLHITERENASGKNQALEREVQHITDFVAGMPDRAAPFYFNYEVWKNSRIGLVSNTINPQGSTIHRHVIGAKQWNTTVDTIEKLDNFKLAVAAAFGYGIDKKSLTDSKAFFEELILKPEIAAGIEAVKNIKDATSAQIQTIMNALDGYEGMHSLDGLVALSAYTLNGIFETNIGLETDGITNGVIIGLLQSMNENDIETMLAAGGIFTDGITKDYAGWADGITKLDSYQRLATLWSTKLATYKEEFSQPESRAFAQKLLGTLREVNEDGKTVVSSAGRNLSKEPLMTTNYGAGIKRIRELLASSGVQAFYTQLVEAETQEDIQLLVDGFNAFTRGKLKAPLVKDVLTFRLPQKNANALQTIINNTYGEALKDALDEQFSGFSEFRTVINNSFKVMFTAFNIKYQQALKEVVTAKEGKALTRDEKQKIIEELLVVLPAIKTALSTGLDDRILVMKTKKSRDTKDPAKRIKVEYSRGIKNTKNVITKKPIASSTSTINETVYDEPGAAGMVLSIQSIDAANILDVMNEFDALNVHDAVIYALDDAVEGTFTHNQGFHDINKNYSILAAVEDSLKLALADIESSGLTAKLNTELAKDKRSKITNGKGALLRVQALKSIIDENRTDIFSRISSVSQVSMPGASYDPAKPISPKKQEAEIKKVVEEISNLLLAEDEKGSAPDAIDFNNFTAIYEEILSSDNSLDIFDAVETLGNVRETPDHQVTLKSTLQGLINKVISPLDGKQLKFDVKISNEGDAVYGAIKGNKVRIHAGTGIIGDNNQISAQETLVHEMVHAISRHGIDNNFNLRKQVLKLFNQVKAETTPDDFLKKDAQGNIIVAVDALAERAAAQARYDYIFDNTNSLHEFIAYGLTNKIFADKLKTITTKSPKQAKPQNLKDKLLAIYESILDWISGRIYGTADITADKALLRLTEEIVGINDRHRKTILDYMGQVNSFDAALKDKLNEIIFSPLKKYYEFLKEKERAGKSKLNTGERTAKTLIGIPALLKDEASHLIFSDLLVQIGKAIKLTEDSFIVKLAREVSGVTKNNAQWHRLLRFSKKFIDQARKHLADNVTSDIREHFSQELTKEESTALNKALLKTDLVSIADIYTVNELIEILSSRKKLGEELAAVKIKLTAYGSNGNYYINQADSLGHVMAVGKALRDDQMLNAFNIANLTAVEIVEQDGDINAAEALIEQYATLSAIKYTSITHTQRTADIMKREYEVSPEDNGVIKTLNTHNLFKKQSLDQLFKGQKALMIKGYTHETYNPAIDIKMGTVDDAKVMAEAGYERVTDTFVPKDALDTNRDDLVMYVTKTSLTNEYLKTITSLTNKKAKGTSLFDAFKDAGNMMSTVEALLALHKIKARKSKVVQKQFKVATIVKSDPTINMLIPIVNHTGEITGYRYLMSEHTKDTTLEKDNRFDVNMGKMMGSIVDKVQSARINKNVLRLAHEDYRNDFAKNPSRFVTIGPDSSNARYREIWDMMPEDMKNDMREIWSDDALVVKHELIDLIFGYRKLSLSDSKIIKVFTDSSFGKMMHADSYLRLAGNIWQEIVGIAKDNIVIKSWIVLKDNIISNNFLLFVKGVPMKNILKNQAIALRALDDYQKEVNKRDKLQRTLDSYEKITPAARKNIKNKITRLNDNIKQNPVRELVDEGIFQNIVEDIDIQDHDYDYKTKLVEKITSKSEHYIPKGSTEVFKQAYLAKDTFVYKQLLKGTQYSDFVARFTLYQHLRSKGMKKDAAIIQIIDTFINYDVPTSPELQYLNDMGVLMFSKFLFRIQRVIFNIFKENPANVLSLHALQVGFGNIPDITDSNLLTTSLISRIHNPLIRIPDEAMFLGGYELAENIIN